MSQRFLTLKKTDPKFENWLWGQGPKGIRPLPVQSMNVDSQDETVTFELRPEVEIKKPSLLFLISSILKLKNFILILFPLFYVLSKNFILNRFHDPFSVTFAALAVIFIFAGLNLRNDVSDHLTGFDRVNIPFDEKPIQVGWVTAKTLSRLSWVLIGIGVFLSIPVLILQQHIIRIVIEASLLLIVGNFFRRNSYKEKLFGELVLFLLIGIELSVGYQVSLGARIDPQILLFGLFWGAIVLFLVQINNLSHLVTSVQAGIKNTMTRLGFDRAKLFLSIWWAGCFLLWVTLHILYSTLLWTTLGTVLVALFSLPLLNRLLRLQSPLGSGLIEIRQRAYKTFLFMVFLYFIEMSWFVGEKLNWNL